jgi:tryptophanyl-tRNA synthetase
MAPVAAPASPHSARVFSGIQPSGELHIGNYLGANRTWAKMVRDHQGAPDDLLFCIADAHAITVAYEPAELRKRIVGLARDLLACGLDQDRCTLFVQSDVPEHMELAWYLAAVTPMGDLSRMTQFKDKSEGNESISAALYTYPVLMSADILLYRATVVPVGDDQVQHLELARETVRRFNHRFGAVLQEPQPQLSAAPRIMGLDGSAKMSKSKDNTIALFETQKVFFKKLKGAFTDPQRTALEIPGRPDVCNIFTMHNVVSPPAELPEIIDNCERAKWGCFHCKERLMTHFDAELGPLRERRAAITDEQVHHALNIGADRARRIAQTTMADVRRAMGVGTAAAFAPQPAAGKPVRTGT